MDLKVLLEFVARSEWPLIAGFAIWVFRGSFRGMIERMVPTKLDVLGMKAEFAEKAELIAALTEPADENTDEEFPTADAPQLTDSLPPDLVRSALGREGRYLVNETWHMLERELEHSRVRLTKNETTALDQLRELRDLALNMGVHGQVEINEALKFQSAVNGFRKRVFSRHAQQRRARTGNTPPSSATTAG